MDLQAVATAIADAYEPPVTGRPSAIADSAKVSYLLKCLEQGDYRDTVTRLAGISYDSFMRWLKRGDAGEEPYDAFCVAVKMAEARAEHDATAKVRRAGEDPRFWAAEMTFMERRYPEKWGRRSENSDGPKVVVQIGVQGNDVQVSASCSSVLASPSLVPRNELGE